MRRFGTAWRRVGLAQGLWPQDLLAGAGRGLEAGAAFPLQNPSHSTS